MEKATLMETCTHLMKTRTIAKHLHIIICDSSGARSRQQPVILIKADKPLPLLVPHGHQQGLENSFVVEVGCALPQVGGSFVICFFEAVARDVLVEVVERVIPAQQFTYSAFR